MADWGSNDGEAYERFNGERLPSLIMSGRFSEAVGSFDEFEAFYGLGKTTLYHSIIDISVKQGMRETQEACALFGLLNDVGVDIDSRNGNHESPLLRLSRISRLDRREEVLCMMKSLLSLGAKPDASDENGMTSTMACCRSGFYEGLELLLASGAKVTVRTKEVRRGLPFFIPHRMSDFIPEGSSASIVEVLRSYGCDLSQKDTDGQTVSHMMAKKGMFEFDAFVCETFMETCGDVKDKYGMTPKDLAIGSSNHEWMAIWERLHMRKGRSGRGSSKGRSL